MSTSTAGWQSEQCKVVAQLSRRAMDDPSFRNLMRTQPRKALEGSGVSEELKNALASRSFSSVRKASTMDALDVYVLTLVAVFIIL